MNFLDALGISLLFATGFFTMLVFVVLTILHADDHPFVFVVLWGSVIVGIMTALLMVLGG